MGYDTKGGFTLVVNTFLRRTYLVLPPPIRRAVRSAMNKRDNAKAMPSKREQTSRPQQSFLADIDEMSNAVFGPLWKE